MKLYDSTLAPNPRRVRIFLAEKGIELPRTEVDIGAGENLSPAFLAINPRGLLPTLVLDDGTVIDESMAICRYFEELQPEPPLMGSDPREKAIVESWNRHIEFDGGLPVMDGFRNGHPRFAERAVAGRAGHAAIPALAERGRQRVAEFYAVLDERLRLSPYVAGPAFTVADITALCIVEFARTVRMPWPAGLDGLERWHQEVSARPSAAA
ncbi:MAG: glutathione S-transferase family protein [Gammaproteobacteria bacterium]